jgi:hypothetical protein
MTKANLEAVHERDHSNPRLYFALTAELQPQIHKDPRSSGSAIRPILKEIRQTTSLRFEKFDSLSTLHEWLGVRSEMSIKREADVAQCVANFERKLADFKKVDRRQIH